MAPGTSFGFIRLLGMNHAAKSQMFGNASNNAGSCMMRASASSHTTGFFSTAMAVSRSVGLTPQFFRHDPCDLNGTRLTRASTCGPIFFADSSSLCASASYFGLKPHTMA